MTPNDMVPRTYPRTHFQTESNMYQPLEIDHTQPTPHHHPHPLPHYRIPSQGAENKAVTS